MSAIIILPFDEPLDPSPEVPMAQDLWTGGTSATCLTDPVRRSRFGSDLVAASQWRHEMPNFVQTLNRGHKSCSPTS